MFLWNYLKGENRPILLYGMGNGGDKVFDLCDRYGLEVSAVFASDDHARGKLFHGLPVRTYAEVSAQYPDGIILLAFGVYQEDVLSRIQAMAERHPVFAPDLPLLGGPVISPEYLGVHRNEISKARVLLADHHSRFVFDSILEGKLSGSIPLLRGCETDRQEDFALLDIGSHEKFLDLGAYTGDTISEFLSITGGVYSSIDAFEPDSHNYNKLMQAVSHLEHLSLHPYASWSRSTTLTFAGKGGRNSAMKPELPGKYTHIHEVPAIAVDSLQKEFTLVKMDVEGAEAETLLGMQETINRFHPKLFISAYHMTDDFIRLPLLLQELCPGYQMYLRKNPCLPAWEIQLLCRYL